MQYTEEFANAIVNFATTAKMIFEAADAGSTDEVIDALITQAELKLQALKSIKDRYSTQQVKE